jgi:hypothetical protein
VHGVEPADPHQHRGAAAGSIALVVQVQRLGEGRAGLGHVAEATAHPAEPEQGVEPQPAAGRFGGQRQTLVQQGLGRPQLAELLLDGGQVDPGAAACGDVRQLVGRGERAFEVDLRLRQQASAVEVLREVVRARHQLRVHAELVRGVQGGDDVHCVRGPVVVRRDRPRCSGRRHPHPLRRLDPSHRINVVPHQPLARLHAEALSVRVVVDRLVQCVALAAGVLDQPEVDQPVEVVQPVLEHVRCGVFAERVRLRRERRDVAQGAPALGGQGLVTHPDRRDERERGAVACALQNTARLAHGEPVLGVAQLGDGVEHPPAAAPRGADPQEVADQDQGQRETGDEVTRSRTPSG